MCYREDSPQLSACGRGRSRWSRADPGGWASPGGHGWSSSSPPLGSAGSSASASGSLPTALTRGTCCTAAAHNTHNPLYPLQKGGASFIKYAYPLHNDINDSQADCGRKQSIIEMCPGRCVWGLHLESSTFTEGDPVSWIPALRKRPLAGYTDGESLLADYLHCGRAC